MGRQTSDMIGMISRCSARLAAERRIVSLTLFFALGCGIARLRAEDSLLAVSVDSAPPPAATVYPGQELSLDVRLSAPIVMQLRIERWPELRLTNVRTADFTGIDTPNEQFYASSRETRVVDGEEHLVFVLSTRISFLDAGPAGGQGELMVSALAAAAAEPQLVHPLFQEQVGGDWLLGRSRREWERHFELPDFQVAPLPAPPPGMRLGLVGEWRLQTTVSNHTPQVGETIELILRAEGDGDPRAFASPSMQISGWRSRGPQVAYRRLTENDTQLTARRWLASESLAAAPIDMVWLTFCPQKEEYIKHETTLALTIGEEERAERPPLAAEEIPELMARLSRDMKIPWWRNRWWLAGTGVLLAALAFAGAAAARNPNGKGEVGAARRRRRRCRQLQERLNKCEDQELSVILKHEVLPWLIEVWQLEPGTTPEELAERWRYSEPELAAILQTADHLEFASHRQRKPLDIRRLAALLPRLLPALLVGLVMFVSVRPAAAETESLSGGEQRAAVAAAIREPQSPNGGAEAESKDIFQRAVATYYRGEYARAERMFASLQKDDRIQPDLLYNRANCLWRQGERWRTLALFEQACRAAPRDSRLRKSRSALRSQLGLPPAGSRHWPAGIVAMMRDRLRPDEWLGLAAWSLAALGLGLWRRGRHRRMWLRLIVILPLALLLLTMTALVWQLKTTYQAGGHAVMLTEGPMFVAPTTAAAHLHLSSACQREVSVLEQRGGWVKVRGGQLEGWLPRNQVKKVW